MTVVQILWIAIQVVIGYNLIMPLLLYAIAGIHELLKTDKVYSSSTDLQVDPFGYFNLRAVRQPDYAIIVTAYEQTFMLPAVVDSLLGLDYTNYMIYIVADNCDISGLCFTDSRVILLRPEKVLASNTASHFYAISHFQRKHERLTIIDSDNLAVPGYLDELNVFFDKGYHAVQGSRLAKNLDTTLACLDAARDIYYNFYDGKILYKCGSSSTLAGSGMAFTTDLYKKCLEHSPVNGAGFDKVLQYQLLEKGYRIACAEDAIVFDQKTAKPDQLVRQRARWIYTWFKYFSFGFKLVGKGIKNLDWNQFLFGLILLRPPLFIFLLLSFACLLINLFIFPFAALVWAIGLSLFVAGFLISLVRTSTTNKKIYQSLLSIPVFMFYQVRSLLKVRKANKLSVATNHLYNDTPVSDAV